MKESLVITGVAVAVLALTIVPILLLANYQCAQLETRSGRSTDWYLIGGCFVQVNGEMIPLDNWRGEYQRGE